MKDTPAIRRSMGARSSAHALSAAAALARCLTAVIIAALLVIVTALPDDGAGTPAPTGQGIVSMKSASPAFAHGLAALSSADADLPPGDGRDLRADMPLVVRVPVAAAFAAAVSDMPHPAGAALPERPPKSA